MTEKTLTNALLKTLRKELPEAVIFKHADQVTAGIPDISVTYEGITIWFELKYVKTKIHSRELQHYTMLRLQNAGHPFYILYIEKTKETIIVPPIHFHQAKSTIEKNLKGKSIGDFYVLKKQFSNSNVVDFIKNFVVTVKDMIKNETNKATVNP